MYDIVVCGGGSAGTAAAISAAREGAKVLLIERSGTLGGTLTAGAVCYIMDLSKKQGFCRELAEKLVNANSAQIVGNHVTVNPEMAKLLLEQMCIESGVTLLYHTVVTDVKTEGRKLSGIRVFSKSGAYFIQSKYFIDATGDGDICAAAGCPFELGDEDGTCQPMSFQVIVGGIALDDVKDYCIHVPGQPYSDEPKHNFRRLLKSIGIEPSYSMPFLMPLPYETDRFILTCNHIYNQSGISDRDITNATIQGRKEAFECVLALKNIGGIWKGIKAVSSSESIGVRESRRIQGRYRITKDDLIHGTTFQNAACHVTFNVDIHNKNGYTAGDVHVHENGYDIPFEAMMTKEYDNLFMAGRCISGDYFAHASYRVMGNTFTMGESIGKYCAKLNKI